MRKDIRETLKGSFLGFCMAGGIIAVERYKYNRMKNINVAKFFVGYSASFGLLYFSMHKIKNLLDKKTYKNFINENL